MRESTLRPSSAATPISADDLLHSVFINTIFLLNTGRNLNLSPPSFFAPNPEGKSVSDEVNKEYCESYFIIDEKGNRAGGTASHWRRRRAQGEQTLRREVANVDLQPLRLLFENDNIKDKISNKMLDGIGGNAGLFDRLKTNR